MPSSSKSQEPLQVLQAENFAQFSFLVHGFSTRAGGVSTAYGDKSLNLGFSREDSRENVQRNRVIFLRRLGARDANQPLSLVTARQIHSDIIHFVDEVPNEPLAGDGLLTQTPGILLAIQTADCLPVLLVDPEHKAVGVFHAGWRGTVKRIVEKGLGEMRGRFGTVPAYVLAAIGPGIHNCCYEVGEEVREQFASQFSYAAELFHEIQESDPVREKYPLLFMTARAPGHSSLPSRIFLDLVEANRRQLMAAGVPGTNIDASPLCTSCRSDLLFSYRKEKGVTGRMLGVAGILPGTVFLPNSL